MNRLLMQSIIATLNSVTLVDAPDALSGIERALNEEPDVIIVDINLPGKDGYWLLNQLKQNTKFALTPIMALSANAMPIHKSRGLEAGFFKYLSKPIIIPELLSALDEAAQAIGQNYPRMKIAVGA